MYLNIAKWLYTLDINIHTNKESPFRLACEFGHFHIVKWLYELDGNIDILAQKDYAFGLSCRNGHFQIAKWSKMVIFN